ncbi:hypothetical protein [Psychromonas aquimarina]|uniref:hypothetical protein n=1 Tax=Psychromonas aquimarina TaxID=444919 RepID=UPI00042A6E6A|nr:hypothetical protein [Psychromonas aquimarina]
MNSAEQISTATVNDLMEVIEHDLIINNVAKELIKEVVRDAIDLENQGEHPDLMKIVDVINGEQWSELFTESAVRAADLIKHYH